MDAFRCSPCARSLACLIAAAAASNIAADSSSARALSAVPLVRDGSAFEFKLLEEPPSTRSIAFASFADEMLTTGWGRLDIETNHAFPDVQQAYAAGYLEGYLTAHHIFTTQANMYQIMFGPNVSTVSDVGKPVLKFMAQQEAWSRGMVKDNADSDPYWAQVGNVLAQFDGLMAGYGFAADQGRVPHLDRFAFVMLSAAGDLSDIIPAVQQNMRFDWLRLPRKDAERRHGRMGHCSALLKVTGDFSDLLIAHSTWQDFGNTNRIFKHYHFNFSNPTTVAKRVSFSSYPGILASQDDFYMMESGLGMVQTSNSVVNHSIYDEVKPESLLAWQRVRIANLMSNSGEEWYHTFRRHFSGTYANQYMVVDFKLFEPHKSLKPGLLWVIEEAPGLVYGGEGTETLARGYWPSFNVPYWSEIWKQSGYESVAAEHGYFFTYELNPRAKIFRRDQGGVTSVAKMQDMLRYNGYATDPYSIDDEGLPDPSWSVCARHDLASDNPKAAGCYDTKVTSFLHGATRGRVSAVSGPSRGSNGQSLPAFTWRNATWTSHKHFGLPETYDFDFVDIQPAVLPAFSERYERSLFV